MRRLAKIILATRKVSVYSKKLGLKQHHLQPVDYSCPGRTVGRFGTSESDHCYSHLCQALYSVDLAQVGQAIWLQ